MKYIKKISIVVPVYNVEEYLYNCLNSVASQTYKNIEVIVVEDGGKTMETIINSISDRLNVKYFSLEKVGRSTTGNYGLLKSSGEYCLFLDDDDFMILEYGIVYLGELEGFL